MNSKTILACLLLAVIVLVTSEISAARELAETSNSVSIAKEAEKKTNGVDEAKYPGGRYGGYPGGGYGGNPGGGYGGRRGYGGRGGYGGYCRFGCCRRNYYGNGCNRCCGYAGEAVEAQPQTKPHN